VFGPDPESNPRLADVIAEAKKASFTKSSIEAAIARGQGRSATGASLESVVIEGILPQNVAVIIDCETDNKNRTMMDVRMVMKEHGGNATPSSYLFAKKGRIVFEKREGLGVEEIFDEALEAGALDIVEDPEGRVVIYTEPSDTKATGTSLSQSLGLEIAASDIIWDANDETKVSLQDNDTAGELAEFIDVLQDREPSVQGVYLNVAKGSIDEDAWAALQDRTTA